MNNVSFFNSVRLLLVTLLIAVSGECAGAKYAASKLSQLTDEISWEITPEGTLLVHGSGDMPDMTRMGRKAWLAPKYFPNGFRKVVIDEGITSIGEGAFLLPDRDRELDAQLGPVTFRFPESLRKIGKEAFSGLMVENLLLPENLQHIGQRAFANSVADQRSLIIPEKVESVGRDAFTGCGFEHIVVKGDSKLRAGCFGDNPRLEEVSFYGRPKFESSDAEYGDFPVFKGCTGVREVACFNNIGIDSRYFRDAKRVDIRTPDVTAQVGGRRTAAERAVQEERASVILTDASKIKVSDVDLHVPKAKAEHRNTFALVISNENYRRVAHVPHALNDGRSVARYLNEALGIPKENILMAEDATLNDMKFYLGRLRDYCEPLNGEASVIVYYAGHGMPDSENKKVYLLPYDAYAESPDESGLALSDVLAKLNEMSAKETLVFLDACFSGTGRNDDMLVPARGAIKEPQPYKVNGNVVLFSASQGDESAHSHDEQSHGLFTYFLLKKLQDTGGDVTLGELSEYLETNVKRQSLHNGTKQTPTVRVSYGNDSWQSKKL